MRDVHDDNYYKIYNGSVKVDGKLENFALLTFYDNETKRYIDKEVKLNDSTLLDLIKGKLPDMVSVVLYSRGIGLVDDFEIYGKPVNVGRTIYFGKMVNVADYNLVNPTPLFLPLDRKVCMLDCGEVLIDIEPNSDTSDNVLKQFDKQSSRLQRL